MRFNRIGDSGSVMEHDGFADVNLDSTLSIGTSNSPTPQPTPRTPHATPVPPTSWGSHSRPSRRQAGVMLVLVLVISWIVILPVMVGMFHLRDQHADATTRVTYATPAHQRRIDARSTRIRPTSPTNGPSRPDSCRSCMTCFPDTSLSGVQTRAIASTRKRPRTPPPHPDDDDVAGCRRVGHRGARLASVQGPFRRLLSLR